MDGAIILKRITDVAMLKQNIIKIKKSLNSDVKFMLIAKANAYGCGMDSVAQVEDLVDYYGVARANEGVQLRLLGVCAPILVLSYDLTESDIIAKYNLDVAVSSLSEFLYAQSKGIKRAHVAVDTGMNRFGLKSMQELKVIFEMRNATDIVGIFSHIYHNSSAVKESQIAKFNEYLAVAKSFNSDILRHIASSGSYCDGGCGYDMVRVGLACYHNCISIISGILTVKRVLPYEDIGYNGEFVATQAMDIAVVQGGYADGIDKRLNKIKVRVKGKECAILGAICMDAFMIDVTDLGCLQGEKVIVLDSENMSQAIALSGMTEYELLTGLKGRYDYGRLN